MRKLACLMLVWVGCGDSSANSVAEDLAQTVCDYAFGCCTRGETDFLLGPYVLESDCADRLVNSAAIASRAQIDLSAMTSAADVTIELPNLGELQRAIDDGRTRVKRGGVDACISFIEGLGCNELVEVDPVEGCVVPEPPEETPCQIELMLEGQVGAGGACTSPGSTFECEPGLVCRTLGMFGIEGACVAPGGAGDFCFIDPECGEELYCSQADGTCQVPRAEGEACAYSDRDDPSPPQSTLLIECEVGLFCDPVTDLCVGPCQRGAGCSFDTQCDDEQGLKCIQGRCDLPRVEGLPCLSDTDCQEGLRCAQNIANPAQSICQQKLANGDFCSTFEEDDCDSGFCDNNVFECAPQSDPGGLCPTARNAQCSGGFCETQFVSCTDNSQCLGSGVCNTAAFRCEFFCVATLPDGAICGNSAQCTSEACIGGFCRTVPLPDGEECIFDSQCASQFCGVDSVRVCESLPLSNGTACNSNFQCESGICFSQGFGIPTCNAGLREGDRCDQFPSPPCGADLFCESRLQPPECVPVLEAGSECEGDFQCRFDCTTRFARQLCDVTPAEGTAICDGT